MDALRFDALVRSLHAGVTRRGFSRSLAALGLTGGLGSLLALSDVGAKKKHKKKKKCKGKRKCGKTCIAKTACCTDADCVNTGETCVNSACACPDGQDACGGACIDSCPASRVRDPNNCGCCRPSGLMEHECESAELDPCCSGSPCGTCCGGESTACPGRELNDACSFDEQCASPLRCNANLVCA
jgi:hypothetical protein